MNKLKSIFWDNFLVLKKIFKISKYSSLALILALFTSLIGILFDLLTIEQLTILLPKISNISSDKPKELLLFLSYFSLSAFSRLISIVILEKNCAKIGSDLSNYISRNSFLNKLTNISEVDITSRLTSEIHILLALPFYH